MCAYLMCLVHTLIIGISWNRLPLSALFTAPKMQMLVINPTSTHLFGVLHLALLNPSITLGSWINGMQRKAVSALRRTWRIPPACTSRSREEHWGRNRSKHLSHTQNVWWQGWGFFVYVCLYIKIHCRHKHVSSCVPSPSVKHNFKRKKM